MACMYTRAARGQIGSQALGVAHATTVAKRLGRSVQGDRGGKYCYCWVTKICCSFVRIIINFCEEDMEDRHVLLSTGSLNSCN